MKFDKTAAILSRYRLPWTNIFDLPLTPNGQRARELFMCKVYAEAASEESEANALAATTMAYGKFLDLENWDFKAEHFPLASPGELDAVCVGPHNGGFADWMQAVVHRHDESDCDLDRSTKRHMVLLRAWRLLDTHTAVRWLLNRDGHGDPSVGSYHFGLRGTQLQR